MKIAVCDDEKRILAYIADRVKESFDQQKMAVTIDTFGNSADFVTKLETDFYDAVFLDIDMPQVSGFDSSRYLCRSTHECLIIFVSNKEDTVYESFQFQPFRFIRKSCFEQEIDETVRALATELCSSKDNIVLYNGNYQLRIAPSRIKYIECNNKTLKIVSPTDTTELRYRMMDIEEKLQGYGFIRIHKGYLVNYRYINRKMCIRDRVKPASS